MWSFVLLVIVGGYWLARYLFGSLSIKADNFVSKNKVDQESDDWVKFLNTYTPTEQQDHDAFISARCKDEKAVEIGRRIEDEAGIKPSEDMIRRALLAQELKIPNKTLCKGIITDPGKRDRAEVQRKFLCWYDKELRDKGLDWEMLFISRENGQKYYLGDYKLAVPVSQDPELVRGIYFWYPIRSVTDYTGSGDVIVF